MVYSVFAVSAQYENTQMMTYKACINTYTQTSNTHKHTHTNKQINIEYTCTPTHRQRHSQTHYTNTQSLKSMGI